MSGVWQDLRHSARGLMNRPLFTLAAATTLALGIGATTAIFSVVEGVLLRRLPYENPGEIVTVWETVPEWRFREGGLSDIWDRFLFSYPDYRRWRDGQTSFQSVALFNSNRSVLTLAGEPREVSVGVMSASLLPLLGVRPVLGRAFLPGEDGPGAERVALLSHDFWRERWGGDPDVLGRSLLLEGEPFSVVGVLPRGFRFRSLGREGGSGDYPLWIPVGAGWASVTGGGHNFQALGRLRPGVSLEQASAETASLVRGDRPPEERGARVIPRRQAETRGLRHPLLLLFGASGLLLLIASGNMAFLLLGDFPRRQRELVTRRALGAGTARLARQLLTESVLLGMMGSALGMGLAVLGTRTLVGLAPPIPRLEEVGVSLPVLAFSTGVGILTGILFGLAPVLRLGQSRSREVLRRGMGSTGRAGPRLQQTLIAGEIALTAVLLISGALLARSLDALMEVDPGFRAEGVVHVPLRLSFSRYPREQERTALLRSLRQALSGVPGVQGVSGSSSVPFHGPTTTYTVQMPGKDPGPEGGAPSIQGREVLPGYFQAMGIPLLAGRGIHEGDREETLRVAVVSEGLARSLWPGRSPLGARIVVRDTLTVVGIAGDVRHESLDSPPRPTVYEAALQRAPTRMTFVLRTRTGEVPSVSDLRRAVWSVDPGLPVPLVTSAASLLKASARHEGFRTALLSLFALTAALLAAAGVFGVTARGVGARRREMGIRLAVGARVASLTRGMVLETLRPVVAGTVAGFLVVVGLSGFLSRYLFGITFMDVPTYLGVAAGLGGLSVLAAWIPARRVRRLAPMEVLREE